MYKSDKKIIEDTFIPFSIYTMFMMQIDQNHEDKERFKNAMNLLAPSIQVLHENPKLRRRAQRLQAIIGDKIKGWPLRKAYMLISYIASAFYEAELVKYEEGTTKVLQDINDIIVSGYQDIEGLDKQDTSAAKAAPKIINLLCDNGYFNDIEGIKRHG